MSRRLVALADYVIYSSFSFLFIYSQQKAGGRQESPFALTSEARWCACQT